MRNAHLDCVGKSMCACAQMCGGPLSPGERTKTVLFPSFFWPAWSMAGAVACLRGLTVLPILYCRLRGLTVLLATP